ncbi:MAG: hypothetical protein EOO23_04355 [Comamonadaceae bacterium]|nr:MAG: hypothetical protein EOO23_04355 [Comamonadaceae bacterium]
MKLVPIVGIAAAVGFMGISSWTAPDKILPAVSPSCQIKGNISIDTGERIYHVPGQRRYVETNISLQHGERWFCTAEEAERAGWRRARS